MASPVVAFAPVILSRLRGRVSNSASRAKAVDPCPAEPSTAGDATPESQWFWDHYQQAAQQVVDSFAEEGISLTDKIVADVGCGDGIIDLGVFHKVRPQRLVGFDLNPTNTEYLFQRAHQEGVSYPESDGLQFERTYPTHIPADDGAFDFIFSWSAFEHVSSPVTTLREIHRVLSPTGVFFLQLWPFYMSAKGSHLWEVFPQDHHHLQRAESDVVGELEGNGLMSEDWTTMMSREFKHLNRLTVDELQRSMLAAGFVVRRVEFLTGAFRVTPELSRYSWLDLGISGIKLIASAGF